MMEIDNIVNTNDEIVDKKLWAKYSIEHCATAVNH